MSRAGWRLVLPCAAALALAACGGDGDDHDDDHDHDAAATIDADPNAPDAPPQPDAGPSTVVEVTCPGTPALTVTAPSFAFTFDPEGPIAVNDIVEFTMPASHSVVSGTPAAPDGRFAVGFNQTKCFQFTVAGSYPIFCNPHQFTATITVE